MNKYAYRVILWDGDNPDWQYFEADPSLDRDDDPDDIVNSGDIGEAWHRYRATITPTSVTLEFDLFRDGLINTAGAPLDEDFNDNGVVDAADYTVWRDNLGLLGTGTKETGDANGDTNVDELDYGLWKAAFGNTGGGDQPGWDATVVVDTVMPAGAFDNLRLGGPSGLSSPDADGAIFDNISLTLVDVPVIGNVAAVPEPSSVTLVLLAMAAMAARRRGRA